MTATNARKFLCKACGKWGNTGTMLSNAAKQVPQYSYVNKGETAELLVETERRIRTEKDLLKVIDLDTDTWEIEKFIVGKSEGYRKDRQVKWKVRKGVVAYGEVNDTGKLLIVPMFSVKVWLRRKTQAIRAGLAVDDLKRDMQRYAPKYKRIKYPKLTDGMLLEIAIPDAHVGELVWAEESGENSDLKLQVRRVTIAIEELIKYARNFPIEKILFTLGNDFFNSDTPGNTTTAGTPMSEDTRWQKTFRAGRVLACAVIDKLETLAPVDVKIIPGNHDFVRSFHLGDSLECWYRNCPNVSIDNNARTRKYYVYGKCLIMLTHGDEEKTDELHELMSAEEPMLWAQSRFREVHLGHLHHKREMRYKVKTPMTQEYKGVVVRFLRGLTPTDAWHRGKGYIGALQSAELFLWHKEKGVVAQFNAVAEPNVD